MDILLLQPSTFRKNYGDYADAGGKSQPIGVCSIAAVLEDKGIDVDILDADILDLSFEQTLEEIEKSNPKILLISVLTTTYENIVSLAKTLKEKKPSMIIIVGGPHLATQAAATMEHSCFDVGVIGEAEYTTRELVTCLLQKKNWLAVKGIIYKSENGIVKTLSRELIKDLNELPLPAYHLLPNIGLYRPQIHSYRYKPVVGVVTSRGCPYRCIFCDQGVFGKRFRYISGKRIADYIETLQKQYGVKEITFFDDVFTLNKNRVYEMCEEFERRGITVAWTCLSRADHLDKPLLKAMKKAGCWMIAMGIESGSQEILDFIKKDISLERIREVTTWAYEEGIKIRGFFQIGHPNETEKTMEKTIAFAKSLKLHTAEFTISTPFKGTQLYDIAKQYGTFDTSDNSAFSQMFPVFTAKGFTKEYLLKKQKEFHRRYYLRPKKIFEFLCMVNNIDDIKRYWAGAKILLR